MLLSASQCDVLTFIAPVVAIFCILLVMLFNTLSWVTCLTSQHRSSSSSLAALDFASSSPLQATFVHLQQRFSEDKGAFSSGEEEDAEAKAVRLGMRIADGGPAATRPSSRAQGISPTASKKKRKRAQDADAVADEEDARDNRMASSSSKPVAVDQGDAVAGIFPKLWRQLDCESACLPCWVSTCETLINLRPQSVNPSKPMAMHPPLLPSFLHHCYIAKTCKQNIQSGVITEKLIFNTQ